MGADGIVIRHPSSGAPRVLADSGWVDAGIVNAGDGTHEHPTQALLDAFTMRRRVHGAASRGRDLDGLEVMIVGDILHSPRRAVERVAAADAGGERDGGRASHAPAGRRRAASASPYATTSTTPSPRTPTS